MSDIDIFRMKLDLLGMQLDALSDNYRLMLLNLSRQLEHMVELSILAGKVAASSPE